MRDAGFTEGHLTAVMAYLGTLVDRLAVYSSTQCVWHYLKGERTAKTFGRQAITMTWDFAESCPFNTESASWPIALEWIAPGIEGVYVGTSAEVVRGSALSLPWSDALLDAIVTDPPYYDNVPYANISDFFYVWLQRTIGHLYPEHFTGVGTPKKREAVADPKRHNDNREEANRVYEEMMEQTFLEAYRVLKAGGHMVVVYAHKTTLGWATLVDALRRGGFTVVEAWPLDTEMKSRLRGRESSALASSIFLIARKRDGSATGSYEDWVRPELEKVIRERVDSLWKMGITGPDLVIAAVGAGLRAFTRFSRVEYANGEEVPAEKFLAEVEGVVLETLLEKIFGVTGSGVAAVDGPSRFYVLWRYTHGGAEMDAGEAIVFTYGQNVELDGQSGLSVGSRALLEKKKGKYRLRDFTERGPEEKLGLPGTDGNPACLIDTLHRVLWLMENQPRSLGSFLDDADVDVERLRLIAQVLGGAALTGIGTETEQHTVVTTAAEQSALQTLTANWRSLIESRMRKRGETLI